MGRIKVSSIVSSKALHRIDDFRRKREDCDVASHNFDVFEFQGRSEAVIYAHFLFLNKAVHIYLPPPFVGFVSLFPWVLIPGLRTKE